MTQRYTHVEEIKAELRRAGAVDIAVARAGSQVHIAWVLHGRPCHVTAAAHPRDAVAAANMGRQRARRACREVHAS